LLKRTQARIIKVDFHVLGFVPPSAPLRANASRELIRDMTRSVMPSSTTLKPSSYLKAAWTMMRFYGFDISHTYFPDSFASQSYLVHGLLRPKLSGAAGGVSSLRPVKLGGLLRSGYNQTGR